MSELTAQLTAFAEDAATFDGLDASADHVGLVFSKPRKSMSVPQF